MIAVNVKVCYRHVSVCEVPGGRVLVIAGEDVVTILLFLGVSI